MAEEGGLDVKKGGLKAGIAGWVRIEEGTFFRKPTLEEKGRNG
jgi:hypothetical protein